ncbi:DUF4386 domain-containing protein [Aquimarina rhabdastrellae]
MENHFGQLINRRTSKTAGILYIIIVICGIFSILYVPSKVFTSQNAIIIIDNLREFNVLFRVGLFCDTIVFLCETGLAVLLYKLFRQVNQVLSMMMAIYRIMMSCIMAVNLLNYILILILLTKEQYQDKLGTDYLGELIMLFIDIHKHGEYIWSIFFGIHLILLGYLIFKSKVVPQIFGVLIMIGCVGHLMESFSNIHLIHNEILSVIISMLLLISFIGEISFFLWLLFKGNKKITMPYSDRLDLTI